MRRYNTHLKYFCNSLLGIVPPALATPFTPMHSAAVPITPMATGPEVIFSGKHNGICVYFARILGYENPGIDSRVGTSRIRFLYECFLSCLSN